MDHIKTTFLVILAAAYSHAGEITFEKGVKVTADGKPIDVNIGHLVPCSVDWDNDGKKDLLVGQFEGGKIRLYLNQGTNEAPVLNDFTYLQAGGKIISLVAG